MVHVYKASYHLLFWYRPILLFFIYDVEKTKCESDDPLESILYFHPNSSDSNIERRVSVVGQIVGTALCVKQLLSAPKLITLERGKFALSWSGQFILVPCILKIVSVCLKMNLIFLISIFTGGGIYSTCSHPCDTESKGFYSQVAEWEIWRALWIL